MTNKHVEKYFNDVSKDYLQYKYGSYERNFYSVRQNRITEYAKSIDKLYFPKILDAGCGPGIVLKNMLEMNFKGYGIDISKSMLRLSKEHLGKYNNFLLSAAEIEKLPFKENSFDIVYSAGVIEYLPNDSIVLQEFRRVLRKDGILIIPVTNKYSYNLIFDSIINYTRNIGVFFNLFNFVNIKILKRGILKKKQFDIRKHSPEQFRAALEHIGFQIIDSSYFYFLPVPYPLNLLLSTTCNKIGQKMEKLGRTKLGFLGEGYLVACKNIK